MQLNKAQQQWIDQLLDRYGGKPSYRDYFVSVLRANHEDSWPQVMQTLRSTQPGWFK